MKIILSAAAAVFLLSGCDQNTGLMSLKNAPDVETIASCAGSSAPSCRFLNSPVKLEQTPVRLPRRSLVFYPTAEPLEFVDAGRRSWIAPPKTLTDGASIPQIFVSIIGNPTSREFANAAAVHDAYCGVGNEDGPRFHKADWRDVHRMFYDALRVGGTPEGKAKVMYAAVYIGGPRWGWVPPEEDGDAAAAGAGRGAGASNGAAKRRARANTGIPVRTMRHILRRTMRMIGAGDPSLPEIEVFADALLAEARTRSVLGGGEAGESHAEMGYGSESDPGTDPSAPGTGTEGQ